MALLGLFGGPDLPTITGNFGNSDGTIRVLKEKCHNCPYIVGSAFHPQFKRIHKHLKENGGFNYCHNTYPSDVLDAICRGSYDAFISRFNGIPDFIDEPKSSYVVLPVGDE
jgi:hypothetical protein